MEMALNLKHVTLLVVEVVMAGEEVEVVVEMVELIELAVIEVVLVEAGGCW